MYIIDNLYEWDVKAFSHLDGKPARKHASRPVWMRVADRNIAEVQDYQIVIKIYFGKHKLRMGFYILQDCSCVLIVGISKGAIPGSARTKNATTVPDTFRGISRRYGGGMSAYSTQG